MKPLRIAALPLIVFILTGCARTTSGQSGLEVMFDGNPRIYQSDVYYLGQIVGQILNEAHRSGAVFKITVRLTPAFQENFGKNWVFYSDNGRLHVVPISGFGDPVTVGDKLCGFDSKTSLNWFKVKTLLNDRVYQANLKAESLARRFGS